MNAVWADNGDALSIQYAGTGALKGDFTRYSLYPSLSLCHSLQPRTGKRETKGKVKDGVNTISRLIINKFRDNLRQVPSLSSLCVWLSYDANR